MFDADGTEKTFYVHRKFVMDTLISESADVLRASNQFSEHSGLYKLNNIKSFFDASRILKAQREKINGSDVQGPANLRIFNIGGRHIYCIDYENCYMDDPLLRTEYAGFFRENSHGASYLEMSKFIISYLNPGNDALLAQHLIEVIFGKKSECPVIPLLLAVTLVAEPHRNPSCFLPTLMLYDLIRNGCQTYAYDPYRFVNCLQNTDLAEPDEDKTWHNIFADYSRMPTVLALEHERRSREIDPSPEITVALQKINEEKREQDGIIKLVKAQLKGIFEHVGKHYDKKKCDDRTQMLVDQLVVFQARQAEQMELQPLDFAKIVASLRDLLRLNQGNDRQYRKIQEAIIACINKHEKKMKQRYTELKGDFDAQHMEKKKKMPGWISGLGSETDCFYNAPKSGKGRWASEHLMACGGWLPMSSLHSFTELSKKRQKNEETMSDVKAFCIIADWLHMKGYATTMHLHDVQSKACQIFDQSVSAIQEFFRYLEEHIAAYLQGGLITPKTIRMTETLSVQVRTECDMAVKNWVVTVADEDLIDPRLLADIPENDHFFTQSVVQNGLNLEYIPRRLHTASLYWHAVRENGMALQFVEKDAKYPGLCTLAASQNPEAISFVPKNQRTFFISALAASQSTEQVTIPLGVDPKNHLPGETNDVSPKSVTVVATFSEQDDLCEHDAPVTGGEPAELQNDVACSQYGLFGEKDSAVFLQNGHNASGIEPAEIRP